MTSEQRCLIGSSSSPVTRRSSRLMPPVGSSSSSSFGSWASAMAISSHCCWPCDSAAAGSAARSARRNCSRMCSTLPSSARRVREKMRPVSGVCAWNASSTLS